MNRLIGTARQQQQQQPSLPLVGPASSNNELSITGRHLPLHSQPSQQKSYSYNNNSGNYNNNLSTVKQQPFYESTVYNNDTAAVPPNNKKEIIGNGQLPSTVLHMEKQKQQAHNTRSKFGCLTELEVDELLAMQNTGDRFVYYYGQKCPIKKQKLEEYDDSKGDYGVIIGDHVDYRYEVVDVLGKGSFGQVLGCFDHKTREKVAVKIIRNKKRFHQQALVEVKILELLKDVDVDDKYPVVKLKSHFYFRQHLCIVFPLLGANLYEFVKANGFTGFPLTSIRKICTEIVSCLHLLQKQQIIHCDLKPENILLVANDPAMGTPSGIRVIDFGSSCMLNEKIYTYIQSRFYRSPEIVLGLSYSQAIDMWSLGCILAELYTGYPLFPAQDETELMGCLMELIGVPPLDIIMKSTRRKLFFHSNYTPRNAPDTKGRYRRPNTKTLETALRCMNQQDSQAHPAFVDFIRKCLTWDPDFRMTPSEALCHPFLGLDSSALNNLKISSPSMSYQQAAQQQQQIRKSNHLQSGTYYTQPNVGGAAQQHVSRNPATLNPRTSSNVNTLPSVSKSAQITYQSQSMRNVIPPPQQQQYQMPQPTRYADFQQQHATSHGHVKYGNDKRKNEHRHHQHHSDMNYSSYQAYAQQPSVPTVLTNNAYNTFNMNGAGDGLPLANMQPQKRSHTGSWSSLIQGGITKLISGFKSISGSTPPNSGSSSSLSRKPPSTGSYSGTYVTASSNNTAGGYANNFDLNAVSVERTVPVVHQVNNNNGSLKSSNNNSWQSLSSSQSASTAASNVANNNYNYRNPASGGYYQHSPYLHK